MITYFIDPISQSQGTIDPLRMLEVAGDWFTGLMTLTAVILALFLQRLSERVRSPRLAVDYNRDEEVNNRYLILDSSHTHPDTSFVSDPSEGSREELWIRLRVTNNGPVTAKDVEVRFIGVARKKDNVRDNRSAWWFKVSHLNDTHTNLPPRFTHFFDIAFLSNDVGSRRDLSLYLVIVKPELLPWEEEKARIEISPDNKLDLGWDFVLYFAVAAANADAKYYEMSLRVDPRKVDDPLSTTVLGREHLMARIEVSPAREISPDEAFRAPE